MTGARPLPTRGGWLRGLTRPGCALLVGVAALLASAPLAAAGTPLPTAAVAAPAPLSVAGATVTGGDGWLDWGVKESFRQYVEGPIADGTIEVHAPATRNPDGTFRFGDGTAELSDSGTLTSDFGGEVYFEGHGEGDDAELRLWITDPRLVVDGSGGTLFADVRSLSGSEIIDYPDVALAALDLGGQTVTPDPDGLVSLDSVVSTLTADGAPAFGGFYAPGEALDPVSLSVWVEGGPSASPTPTETSSPTSSPSPSPTDTSAPPTSSPPSLPPSPQPSPSASWAPGEISSGLLDWGVKASFLAYISGGIANGGWTTTSGVTEADGKFRWTAAYGDYDVPAGTGIASFAGGVHFTGHDGALDLTLSRPQVRFSGANSAVLLLDVTSKSMGSGAVTEQHAVEFAALDLAAGSADVGTTTIRYGGVPATLTAAGATGFGGFYAAGTELDSISISFAVGGATVPGGGSAHPGGLAHTGGRLDVAVVGGLLVLGGGLLVAGGRVLTGRRQRALA